MPRETVNIDYFRTGLVCNSDAKDIPNDAFVDEYDVDNEAPDGVVRGRLEDDQTASTGWADTLGFYSGAMIDKDDGKTSLIYHESTVDVTNNVEYIAEISDFFGTPVHSQSAPIPVGTKSSAVAHNQEVYFGLGAQEFARPKWAGYITSKRFGGNTDNVLSVADSELTTPNAIPYLHDIVVDDTYIWGIAWQGGYIYRITKAGGAILQSNIGTFKKLQAICDDDATNLWVFDAGVGQYGTLFKVTKSTLAINTTKTLGAFTLEAGAYISDMAATTNQVFLGVNSGTYIKSACVWRFAKASGSGTAPTDCSPRLIQSGGTTAGEWVTKNGDGTYSASYAILAGSAMRNITVSDYTNDKVVYYGRLAIRSGRTTTPNPNPQFKNSGGTSTVVSHVLFPITATMVAGDKTGIISIDPTLQTTAYDGFVWDSSGGVGAEILYATRIKTAYKKATLTYPVAAGDVCDANLTSPTASKALSYVEVVSALVTDTGPVKNIYFTRQWTPAVSSTDIVKSGVDDLDAATFTTLAQVLDGSVMTLVSVDDTSITSWSANRKYYYKVALVYDGYQVTPLSYVLFTDDNTGTGYAKTVTFTFSDITQLNIRASGVIILRAVGDPNSTEPEGFYRQVAQVNFDDARWIQTGNQAVVTIADSVQDGGVPYEQLTGMPEVLPSSMVHYELSTVLNNQLFVAKCWKAEIPEASHFLFRSKTGRYSMFDWSTEFLRLPFVPTAMAAYNGRLFVFDVNRVAVVNPDGLYVEDILVGVGADNPRSVLVVNEGLFVANKIDVWKNDGRGFQPIGLPILKTSLSGTVTGYQSEAHTYGGPVLTYFGKTHSIVLLVNTVLNNRAYVFNTAYNRWDHWLLAGNNVGWTTTQRSRWGAFYDKNGNAYFSQHNGSWKISGATTRKAWYVGFMYFDAGDGAQYKKFYAVQVLTANTDVNNTITIGGGTSPGNRKFQYRFYTATCVTNGSLAPQLENVNIIFRRLIGKR